MMAKTTKNQRPKRRVATPRRVRTLNLQRVRTTTVPAPVNIASNIRSRQPRSIAQQSATDRLFTTTLRSQAERGTVIYDQAITPSLLPRLRQQAGVFQKICWHSLTFEVQTQTPTTTGGGYVVAFAVDPLLEVGSGQVALNAITTMQGAQTSKTWQSVVFSAPVTKNPLFVATGADLRLYSPGRLIVVVDGPPNVDVPITIIAKWTVSLSSPARVQLAQSIPQPTLTASFLYTGGEYVRWENWNPTTNVITPDTEDPTATNMLDAFSGLMPLSMYQNTVYYKLPNPVPILTTIPLSPLAMAEFIGFVAEGAGLVARLYRKPHPDEALYANGSLYLVLSQGSLLFPISPREYSGNAAGAFLVTAQALSSAPGHSQVCKKLQMIQPSEQSNQSRETVSDLTLLSEELNKLYT
nr:putative capsid protein [Yeltsovka tombus-like_virus]